MESTSTPTPAGIVWLIRRLRATAKVNEPPRFEWKDVGRVRAVDREAALDRAEQITGAARATLAVVGIAAKPDGPEGFNN